MSTIQISLNGDAREVAEDCTVAALVEQLDLGQRRIAVEVNMAIVPRSAHPQHRLQPGDKVEIVHAIGGG